MKKILLILAGTILLHGADAQQKQATDWNADLDFLARELPAKHINLFARLRATEFSDGITAIRASLKTSDDLHTALKIQQLIARAGDSHTMLNFTTLLDKNRLLPLKLLWTSDGLCITGTNADNKVLLGRRIEAVNGIPVSTVTDSLSTLSTIDNQALVKSLIPQLLPSLQLLEYFGISRAEQAELTLDGNEKYVLKAANPDQHEKASFKPDSVSFWLKNQHVFFAENYFPEQRIYYMLYNTCWSREIEAKQGNKEKAETLPSFDAFAKRAFGTLKTETVDKIIFDMRNNGGGNSSQGTAFIEKLAAFLVDNPGVSLYVVIGRNTFSSAILNTMDFGRLTDAVLVGEQTAGKPNHFGEVKHFQLPNSGLYVTYSTKYFKRTDEQLDTITPDVTIEMSFADFARGIDPVYEWIKAQAPAKRPD